MAVSIKLNDKMKNRIQRLAKLRQSSPQSIVQEAIREYVTREEARENFKQEALASWAEYKKTGHGMTIKKVIEWLNTWDTDELEEFICNSLDLI